MSLRPTGPLPQLGLLLPGTSEWPPHARFPFNHGAYTVAEALEADLRDDPDPLLITGYASLDRLISFLAQRHRERQLNPRAWQRVRILLGTEPSATTRTVFHDTHGLIDPIREYWLAQGISVYQCAEIIRAVELLRGGAVEVRSSGNRRVHAKIYVTKRAVLLGSSNYSRAGMSVQHEGNIRIASADGDYPAARGLAEAIWDTGQDFCEELVSLLHGLLAVHSWQEALARASADILNGHLPAGTVVETAQDTAELWPSQVQGIAQALWVLRNVGSVLIADATGSGKTRTGAHLLRAVTTDKLRGGRGGRDYAVLVCPPKVRAAWDREAVRCRLALNPISQGVVSTRNADAHQTARDAIRRADILAVDEAHNYLNRATARTQTLYANRADHVILFTATPINRGTHDLLAIVDMLGADNFGDDVLDVVQSLWRRTRRGGPPASAEELTLLRHGIQQFTVRRTKDTFNRIIDDEPARYRNARGERCRYPKHVADDYAGGETLRDCEVAREIQIIAGELRGMSRLRRIQMPENIRRRLSASEFLNRQLSSARALAQYQVRETLRSSRVALAEHLFGTRPAASAFGVDREAKRNATGDVIGRLGAIAGRPPRTNLAHLPDWLSSDEAHHEACEREIGLYRQIGDLLKEISSAREDRKIEVILRLMQLHRLVLAFDRHVLTLRYFESRLREHVNVLVATGGNNAQAARLNSAFGLESDAQGIVALCSDAMSEGINLQAASAMVLLDLPSVIRLIEQRIGRIDRMDSPHDKIQVLWPNDKPEFALRSDDLLVARHDQVEALIGSNILLPEDLRTGRALSLGEVRAVVEGARRAREEELDLLSDAFGPVRDLIEGERALIPAQLYQQMVTSHARVLASVSVVPSDTEWGFFAIGRGDRSSPRWVFMERLPDGRRSAPQTDLRSISELLRERLHRTAPSLPPDDDVAHRMREDLAWLTGQERQILSRRKQRALEELERVLRHYHLQSAPDGRDPNAERRELVERILRRLSQPTNVEVETTLDWEKVAEWWTGVIRPVWQEHLASRTRSRPARLRDIRKVLIAKPLSNDVLASARSEEWDIPDLGRRLVSAILGVRTQVGA